VAVVSDSGLVTGVSAGTTSITYTSEGVSASATITVVPQPILDYQIRYSTSSNRSNSRSLGGANVTGDIYVFVTPSENVKSVSFYIDDQQRQSSPFRTETNAPFDLAGTQNNGRANSFDIDQLGNGPHRLDVRIELDDDRTVITGLSFSVDAPPPPPPPLDPDEYQLLWSTSSNRSNPMPLDGATVSGSIYVFAGPDQAIESVSFYIDDPSMSGEPYRTETNAPFDLQGTRNNGRANSLNTDLLVIGQRTFTMKILFANGEDALVKHATVTVPAPPLIFKQVSVGFAHVCGVTTDDVAYCWGAGNSGRLGNGSTDNQLRPIAVSGGHTFVSISAGTSHTCALTDQGDVYCWGVGASGRLGNGTANQLTPVPVAADVEFRSVHAGNSHTCAVSVETFSPYCWGSGFNGALGSGSTANSTTPLRIPSGQAFLDFDVSVGEGSFHSCGVDPFNTFCWGRGSAGQLGDGSEGVGYHQLEAVLVNGDQVFEIIATGGTNTCGVSVDGPTFCWGSNNNGQLGTGNGFGDGVSEPVPVLTNVIFKELSVGFGLVCGISLQGDAYCWGSGLGLGDGSFGRNDSPTLVSGGHKFAKISVGSKTTCAITTDGLAYCWGFNNGGRVGDGTEINRLVPVPVAPPAEATFPFFENPIL
jgi:alpha-tubulin suppressor-like RCC1 family protein